MDVFDRLKQAAASDWAGYVDHEFVVQLGDGSLPQAAFRCYLAQDHLFLIQFARAWGLAAYKSRTITDIRAAQAGLPAYWMRLNFMYGYASAGVSPAEGWKP